MASASRRAFLVGAGALLAGRAWAEEERVLSNARILVGDGTEQRGGVRIRGGRIAEVGPQVTGGEDQGGATLYPGIYDGGSTLGLTEVDLEADTHDASEASDSVTPHARVVDGYNPLSDTVAVARTGGVLGALVLPGAGTLVPGRAAWMRMVTTPLVADALLAEAGVCFSLGHNATGGAPGSPKSRMGVAMKLRDLFDANPAPEPPPEGKPKKGAPPPPPAPTALQKAIHALRRKETKALFVADRADDLVLATELARVYGLDAVIVGGAEAHLVAPQLAAAGLPVLLGPVTVQPDSFQHLYVRYENAAILHAAGVRFAFRLGDPHRLRDGTTEAGIAVAYGLPYGAGIAALTGNGPGFWGLDVGRVQVGHRASLVRVDGDPLQPRTKVTGLWMDGAPVPLVDRQTRLYDRFRTLK